MFFLHFDISINYINQHKKLNSRRVFNKNDLEYIVREACMLDTKDKVL